MKILIETVGFEIKSKKLLSLYFGKNIFGNKINFFILYLLWKAITPSASKIFES